MTKRALLIGGGGFIGTHLAAHLAREGWEVTGTGRKSAPHGWTREWISADVRDARDVTRVVRSVEPSIVFQLAATPSRDLQELLAVGVIGTANTLAAIASEAAGARVLVIGSAAEYGAVTADDLPVAESCVLRPVSDYGVAKAAQTLIAQRPGANAVVARVFNVTGPGEPTSLVGGAVASQIAGLEASGVGGTIDVGNTEAERDFVDVRDVARAVALLAERGSPGEAYNVCSGTALRIGEFIERIVEHARVPIEVRVDPARKDRPDVPRMVGSMAKLRDATGWTPSIGADRSLADLLDSWRFAPTAA